MTKLQCFSSIKRSSHICLTWNFAPLSHTKPMAFSLSIWSSVTICRCCALCRWHHCCNLLFSDGFTKQCPWIAWYSTSCLYVSYHICGLGAIVKRSAICLHSRESLKGVWSLRGTIVEIPVNFKFCSHLARTTHRPPFGKWAVYSQVMIAKGLVYRNVHHQIIIISLKFWVD